MNKTGKRVPISAASNIGKEYGYSQVIITSFDKQTGTTSVCTWGETANDCAQAAEGGNFVKKALNWPPEKCDDQPSRVKKLMAEITDLKKQLKEAHDNRSEADH